MKGNEGFNLRRFLKSFGYVQSQWGDTYVMQHPGKKSLPKFTVCSTYGYWSCSDKRALFYPSSVDGLTQYFLENYLKDKSEFQTLKAATESWFNVPYVITVCEAGKEPFTYLETKR
jgi:hypothetical protein